MEDDMMATPLNKLPPPLIQSNKENGPVMAPTYDDLRNSVAIPRAEDNAFQGPPQPAGQSLHAQQQHFSLQQPQQMQQHAQFYDAPPAMHYEHPQYSLPPPPAYSHVERKKKKRPPTSSFLSIETLKRKQLWVFAGVVVVLVAYGLPKLRATFPSVVDPLTGATKFPALVAFALIHGLAFTFINDTMLQSS